MRGNKIPIENKDLGLLKLINFSDNQCDQNVLQSCLEFAQKLVEMDNSEYNKLNLLQIKKRLNTSAKIKIIFLKCSIPIL